MIFPYTDVGGGRFRPLAAIRLWGPKGPFLRDGLLDTGSDRLLIMPDLAEDLGIDVNALSAEVMIRVATGQDLRCKVTTLCVQLVRDGVELTWLADVAIALSRIRINHWGFKGFLEFFDADFNGPKRLATLTPGDNLPVTTAPS